MIENLLKEQKKIAEKFGMELFPSNPQSMIGISKEVTQKIFPVHGLRHLPEGMGTGWFIWAGESEIPEDPKFFSPIHAEHIFSENPLIAKYLGLPPGWRFLIDDTGHEDVWFDEKLLNV